MTDERVTRGTVWKIAVVIGLLAFGFRLINVRDLPNDHYMHLAWAQQLLFGELPGRDFVDPGMPLTYILSAFVQRLSPGPFSEAVVCCLMLAIAAGVTFVFSAELTGSVAAGVATALMEVALFPRLYSYPKILVPAVVLFLIQRYARRPGSAALSWLAVWTALAVLLRHDLGVYAAAGIATALLWTRWPDWSRFLRDAGWYAAVVVAVMIPYVLFVQWAEGLGEHFHEAVEFARGEAHQRFLSPPAFPFFTGAGASWSADDSAVLLFYAAHVIAVGVLLVLATQTGRKSSTTATDASRAPVVGAALSMFVLYLVVVLRHPIVSRIQDLAGLLPVLSVWIVVDLGRRMLRTGVDGTLASRVVSRSAFALVVAIAAATTVSVWHLGGLTERLRDTRVADGVGVMGRTIAGVRETGTEWPWQRFWPAGELPEAIRYLNACTTPDEAVLMTWAAPEYYFFAKRRFAAGHALFLPPDAFTTPRDQERMLARIRRQQIPIALINETRRMEFALAYGQVDRYLQQEYVPSGHFRIREGSDVTIAIRRDLQVETTYGPDRWPCGFASRAASKTASTMLEGSAMPFPAMSNAVP